MLFSEVQQQVYEMSKNHHDRMINSNDIQFASLENMIIDGHIHPVSPRSQSMITTKLKIPHNYLQRCSPSIQARQLNYWMDNQQDRDFLVRFDGEMVRSLFSNRYKITDNQELLNQLEAFGIRPNADVELNLDSDFLSLSIPNQEETFDIGSADYVVPGYNIINSEVGVSSLRISGYNYRLACSNGMVSKVNTGTSMFRHVSRKAIEELPLILNQIGNQSQLLKDQFALSLESKVDYPADTFRVFNKRYLLDKTEIEAVDLGFQFEPGETMFHIVNAYTRGANQEDLHPESSHKLQRVGGDILSLIEH